MPSAQKDSSANCYTPKFTRDSPGAAVIFVTPRHQRRAIEIPRRPRGRPVQGGNLQVLRREQGAAALSSQQFAAAYPVMPAKAGVQTPRADHNSVGSASVGAVADLAGGDPMGVRTNPSPTGYRARRPGPGSNRMRSAPDSPLRGYDKRPQPRCRENDLGSDNSFAQFHVPQGAPRRGILCLPEV